MLTTPAQPISRFIVLGCGHTGTTLISGILHINGYGSFKVSTLFENIVLNDLNQRLLDGEDLPDQQLAAFFSLLERKTGGTWSLKDPRLSETISRIYPHVQQPIKFIFNYRHPGATVRSLLREREMHQSHLSSEEMLRSAEDEWLQRNLAVLKFLAATDVSPALITCYDDIVDRSLDEILCRFVGRQLDLSFIEPKKRHSTPLPVRSELLELYEELNERKKLNTREVLRTTHPVPMSIARRRTIRTRFYLLSNRIINSVRSRTREAMSIAEERVGVGRSGPWARSNGE